MISHFNIFIYIISLILGFGIYIRLISKYKKFKFSMVYYLRKYIIFFTLLIIIYFIKNYLSINLVFLNEYEYFILVRLILLYIIFIIHYIFLFYLLKAFKFIQKTTIDFIYKYIIAAIFVFFNIKLIQQVFITLETKSIIDFTNYIEYSNVCIHFLIVVISIWKLIITQKRNKSRILLTREYFSFFIIYYIFHGGFYLLDLDYKAFFFLIHNVVFFLASNNFFLNYFSKKELIQIHDTHLFKDLEDHGITDREWDIINLIIEGKTNKEIANELYISVKTVKHHIYHIFKKLNVRNRIELINYIYKFNKINQS